MGTSEPLVPHLNDACPRSMSVPNHTSNPVSSDNKRRTLPTTFGRLVDHLRFSRRGRRAVACDDPQKRDTVSHCGPLLNAAIDYVVDKAVHAAVGDYVSFAAGSSMVNVPEKPFAQYATRYESVPVSLLGRTVWAFTGEDLYHECYVRGKVGYLKFGSHTISNTATYLTEYGINPMDRIDFISTGLLGGSKERTVRRMVLRSIVAIVAILFSLAYALFDRPEDALVEIDRQKRKMHRNLVLWVQKVVNQKVTTETIRSKRKWGPKLCPQNVAVSMLEQEVILERECKTYNLSNAEWEKAYAMAVENFSLCKLEAQSLSFSGMEEILENTLAVCEKQYIDDYVKLSEDIIVMLLMLSRARTRMDTAGAFAVFAKLRVKGSLTLGAFRYALLLGLDWFFAPTHEQSYALEDIRKIMENYKDLKHSALAERLHCFMLYALGYSLFESIGMKVEPVKLKHMADAAKDRGAWKSADFTYLCLETILFVCERGSQCYKVGSLQPMFHSTRTHEKWINDCEKIKVWSTALGNPEPHGFSVFQYQNELEELIEKGESIVKVMAAEGPKEKWAANKILNELKMLKAAFISTNDASKDRIEPFGVLIAGGSSVMKSTFSKLLFYHYAKVMGLPGASEYRYVRNFQEEFWNGFKTSKWCIHLDDIAPFKPNAVVGVDPSVAEALQVVNTVAYVTNQAELADKGRIPIRSRLVTASTNVVDLNAFAYYENDLAPRRRFPMVVSLEMKPQYVKDGMCASSSIPHLDGEYHDVWIITLYKVACGSTSDDIVGKQRAKLEYVATYEDIDDFLQDFSAMAVKQFEVQKKAKADDEKMAKIEICHTCYRRRCNCFTPQAHEFVEAELQEARARLQSAMRDMEEETKHDDDNTTSEATEDLIREHWGELDVGEYPDSKWEDDGSMFHSCAYDKIVELVERTERGWKVRDLRPSAISYASGAFEFEAHKEDLYRGPGETLMWCGKRSLMGRSDRAFNPAVLSVDVDDAHNITEDYFVAVRKKKGPLTTTWWASFPTQWAINFFIDYRIGRWLAVRLFVWKYPRRFIIWLASCAMSKKFYYIARLSAKKVDQFYRRHEYLVKIGAACAIALSAHLALKSVIKRNNARPVCLTTEEIDAAKDSEGNIRLTPEMLQKLNMTPSEAMSQELPSEINSEPPVEREPELPLALLSPQMKVHAPIPHAVEYENVWADHDTKQIRFSVSDMSASWAGMSWENVHTKVKWNTALFTMREKGLLETRVTATRALCITSRIYLVNKHAFKKNSEVTMTFESNSNGVSSNIVFPMKSVRVYEVPDSDIVAVEVIHAPVRKNLIPLAPISTFHGRAEGMYVIRHPDSVERVPVSNVRFEPSMSTGTIVNQPVYIGRASRDTQPGECGSPLFGRVNGAVMLMGMHAAGHGPYFGALAFTQDQLNEIVSHFTFARVTTGEPQLKVGEIVQHIGPSHHKSHTFFEQGVALVVGADPTFRPKGASRVAPTFIADAMEKRGFTTDKQAPNLKSWKPFSLALKDLLATNRTVDVEILHACAEDYVSSILPHLKEGWKEDVHFYPVETALNGADGVAYVDAINKNTSAGAPVHCSKRRFLVQDPETGKWSMKPEMERAVESVNAAYANKEKANPIFMAHLKDQAIPEKKVKADKVRVFVGGPMAWTIAVRQRLLWFIRLAQCNRLLFELGAGTVAQSTEWGRLYQYLTHHGKDRIVAGDFGKFDKRMGSCFILYAYWIIVQFAEAAGMTQDEIDEIWCVAEDTAFAFTNFNGDLMMFMGSNPSGHPLTVIVNSLVNSLYMRYVFRQVAPEEERSNFKKHVRLYTYGDDNIMGVRPGSDWFNHTVIAAKLAEIGVEYTMADKESESVPFIHIDDASFLKRKWRFDEDAEAILAPLEEESIIGSLMIGIVEKDTVPKAHAIAVMQGALNEFFFHGKSKFEEFRNLFASIIQEKQLSDWLEGDLRTWDQCMASFERSSRSFEKVKAVYTDEWLDTLG